ncbi:MAG TPA: FG-GAP-like repeat-containing protein [Usitatibacter sp.]|jgi:WD40 repeat protein|nr:FG-GAP-like repeat-containing protein [Usitatibacter sp.]
MDARRWMVVLGLVILLAGFNSQAATTLQWTAEPIGPAGKPVMRGLPDRTAALDSAGNLYLVGRYCADPTVGQPCENDGMFLAKYAADTGQELWRFAQTTGPFGAWLNAVAVDAADNVYVVGGGTPTMDVTQYFAKFSSDGTLLWQVNGVPGQSSSTNNGGIDVELDANGNPYVLGYREGFTIVTRYAPADGSALWTSEPAYDDPTTQNPFAFRIDRDGNPVGATFAGSHSFLFKLDGATGDRLWQTPLPYVEPGPDNPFTMRAFNIDGAGKPLIGGSDLEKYSNVDGSLIWSRPFDASGGTVYGVAALSNGDVVAVGEVGVQPYIARFVSASGDTIWATTIAGGSSDTTGRLQSVQVGAGDVIAAVGFKKYSDGFAGITFTMDPVTHALGLFGRYVESSGQSDPQKVLISPDGVFNVAQIDGLPDFTPVRILKYIQAASAPGAKIFDLNGDGNADLVVQHADGSVEVRLMQGTTVIGSNTFVPSAPGHIVTTTGDFNGDGKSDLLYARNDGAVEMWLMDGSALTSITTIMPAGTGWSVAHVGDFNGDGKSDLLWRNTSGAVGLWLMDGSTVTSRASLMAAGSQWSPEQVGDFNGDGNTDIVWRNSDGTVSMWLMNGTAISERGPLLGTGNAYSPIQVGDFNHDGKSDLVFQSTDGSVQLWLMDGRSSTSTATIMGPNTNWTVTQVGDFNGDGNSDLIWTSRDGTIGMWLMNGTTIVEKKTEMAGGNGWSVIVAGDLNGNLKTDLVLGNTNGAVGGWLMNGTSIDSRAPLEPAGSTNRVVPMNVNH